MVKSWTWSFTLLLVVSNGLDLLSTYHGAPDLSGEVNPVVAAMGGSWTAAFMLKGMLLLSLPVVFFFSLDTLKRRSNRLAEKEGCFSIFNHLIFKRHVAVTGPWAWPRDWGALIAVMGIFFSVTGAFAILAAIANLFSLINSRGHLIGFYSVSSLLIFLVSVCLINRFIFGVMQAERSDSSDAVAQRE